MARWEPNARERLAQAAMELYRERGFDETAVADIAARAGLTERTFFRYFTDKREVLFGGASELQELLAGAIATAPAALGPLDVVAAALAATSPMFEGRRPFAKARHAVITGHAALMERELIKLAALATAIAAALRARGVPESAAILAAETGVAIFKLAFARWVSDSKKKDLAHHLDEALGQLKLVAAAPATPAPPATRRRNRRAAG